MSVLVWLLLMGIWDKVRPQSSERVGEMEENTFTASWRAGTSHSALPGSFRGPETACFRTADRALLLCPPAAGVCPAWSQRCHVLRRWGGEWWYCSQTGGFGNICHRISVLPDSRLGFLVFAWRLVLIKGICHVQRPLFSLASTCPYVISLLKLCLWLCQVSTVALRTRM